MQRTQPLIAGTTKYGFFFLTLAALAPAALATPHPATPHLAVPPESFLNYHAASVSELSQEVSVDPQVRARLARHFHVTPTQMQTYIHRNLVLRRLPQAGTYRVACVRRDGSEYYVNSHLPAGTPVFVSRATGQPILKLACGNPMVSTLPETSFPNKKLAAAKLATTPVMVADADMNAPVLAAIDGTQSDLITPDDTTVPPVVLVSPSLQLLGGSSGLSRLFPALLGAGAAIAVAGSHHGGSNTPLTPPTPAPPVPVPPTPVPEASTVASFGLLLAGGSLLVLRRRKARTANA